MTRSAVLSRQSEKGKSGTFNDACLLSPAGKSPDADRLHRPRDLLPSHADRVMIAATSACTERRISPAGSNGCPDTAPLRKIFRFRFTRNHDCISPFRLTRGALRGRHERRVRDAVGVSVLRVRSPCADERQRCARSSRVVLAPRSWCHACVGAHAPRGQRWPESPAHRGEREAAVKTIARGMPGCSRLNLWYLPPAFFSAGGPWVRPAPGIPRALFKERAGQQQSSDATARREIGHSCLITMIARFTTVTTNLTSSLRAKRRNPGLHARLWIASSLTLLAMTGREIEAQNTA